MAGNMCAKLLLEGTRLTFKTEIALALNAHPRIVGPRKYAYHSPVVSGEWGAFTNSPWGRGLINFSAAEEAVAMETFATWVRLWELQRYYSWIVDRFHLSTMMHQRLHEGREYDLAWVDRRMAAVGFRLIHCVRDPATFEGARERRLLVSGNPGQYDDLGRFVREQEAMEDLARASALPRLRLDVSDNDIGGAGGADRGLDGGDGGALRGVVAGRSGRVDPKPSFLAWGDGNTAGHVLILWPIPGRRRNHDLQEGGSKNGTVVLEDAPELAEGTAVSVEVVAPVEDTDTPAHLLGPPPDRPPLPPGTRTALDVMRDLIGTADGLAVECTGEATQRSLNEVFRDVIGGGSGSGLPADYAVNWEHYVYGHPKQQP